MLVLGSGWLSGEIASQAVARGDEVATLARGVSSSALPGVTFVKADRDDPNAYDDVAAQTWDVLVDISTSPKRVRDAASALASKTQHCIYISTTSVYVDDRTPNQDELAKTFEPNEGGEISDPELYGAHKTACENIEIAAFGKERVTVIRPGLIGGPGDRSDRSGYWPIRFARPSDETGRVLIPDEPELDTQLIDVRDLAAFAVHCARERIGGTFNALGETLSLAEHLAIAQRAAGFGGTTVAADSAWLVERGVSYWMGPKSLPLWLPLPDYAGFGTRDVSAARKAGLVTRSLQDTLTDTLAWEKTREITERRAGLSDDDERALLRERTD
ncbi:MAG TPA: NAD-dependent epimerase/dehydratase family protein [Candidatus Tumulicola sp.]